MPSHLVVLYTLGINTALVIDIGFEETTILPICEGTPLIHAWQAQPLGVKAIQEYVQYYNNLCIILFTYQHFAQDNN